MKLAVFTQRPLAAPIALVVATVCVGAVVALAPVLPVDVRIPLLNVALAAWTLAAIILLFALVNAVARRTAPAIQSIRVRERRTACERPRVGESAPGRDSLARPTGAGFERAAALLGLACIFVAVVAATSLCLVRAIADRPDLLWNIDWRYTLSHAQTVARTGGTERALDYAGVPIEYHVGPAWLAGAWGNAFGAGVPDVLFGAVPLLSILALAAGLLLLLANHGLSLRTSLAATGTALVLPAADLDAYRFLRSPRLLLDEDTWDIGISLMLNSYCGLAVGACALALLTMRRTRASHFVVGAIGLAALIAVKPQYFVGFGLLAGIVGLCRIVPVQWFRSVHANPSDRSARVLWVTGLLMVAGSVLLKVAKPPPTVAAFLVPAVIAALLLVTRGPADASSRDRNPGLVAAAATSLVIAVGLLEWLPAVPTYFGRPAWAPGATGWSQAEHVSISTLLFVVATATLASYGGRAEVARDWPGHILAWQSLLAIALIATTLHLIVFPVRPDVVARGLRLGGHQIDAFRHQYDIAQAWLPLRVLMVSACVGAVCHSVATRSRSWQLATLTAIACLFGLRAASLIPPLLDPSRGYEAAEDPGLRRALAAVPVEGTLLVSSDIADPAQDYSRPANGSLLPGYRGHSFFLSELRYIHWTRPDAPERLDALRAFFGASWSAWHDEWLASHGITHILVSDRCRPVWFNATDLPLRELARRGAWTALEVESDDSSPATHADDLPPPWVDIKPAYGRSECLLFRRFITLPAA